MQKLNVVSKSLLMLLTAGVITFSCKDEQEDVLPIEEDSTTMSVELSANSTGANLIYEETFEGTKPFSTAHGIETGASHSLTYVSKPGQSGKAARFELRDNDPIVKGSIRAEVTIVKDVVKKDMWYGFEAYFPSDGYVDESDDEVINQWHQSDMGSPSMVLRTKSGRFELRVGNDPNNRQQIDLGPVTKNTWHKFVFHVVHSSGSDGLIELWMNDKKVVDRKGGNLYSGGGLPKWKLGVYKSKWAKSKTATSKRVLFFDNIMVGNEKATLSSFGSSSGGGTITPSPSPSPTPTPTPTPSPTPAPENPDNGTITSFTLVDSNTNRDIMTIRDGATINLKTLKVSRINIRANANSTFKGNVLMDLTGPERKNRVDDELPYALFGDTNGNYHNWSPTAGTYTLNATPRSGTKSNSGKAVGPTATIRFTIVK